VDLFSVIWGKLFQKHKLLKLKCWIRVTSPDFIRLAVTAPAFPVLSK